MCVYIDVGRGNKLLSFTLKVCPEKLHQLLVENAQVKKDFMRFFFIENAVLVNSKLVMPIKQKQHFFKSPVHFKLSRTLCMIIAITVKG